MLPNLNVPVSEMPLFLYLKEFLFFQHPPKFLKNHHRSIHNIRLQMIIDIQVFEFSNTCTVGASMAYVDGSADPVSEGVHRSQPPADCRQARVPTGHCLRTNGTSEWMPTVSDSPSARSPTATNVPQAELHSVHSFLYFPIGTNVIGLLCTSYKNSYKQGAESLLVADWSKIGHLNKRLGEPVASAGSFPPYNGFTVQC